MIKKDTNIKIISISVVPPGFLYSGFIIGLGDDGLLYRPHSSNGGIWYLYE